MTTAEPTQEPTEVALQEALDEWGDQFSRVVDDVSNDAWSLLEAPEGHVPCELLDWAMATMRNIARPLRAASEELFPLDPKLKASIDKMFERPVEPDLATGGDGRG